MMSETQWYKINNPDDLITPALLVYPDRIEKNIQKMIEIAGGTEKLRPHIKTHKIAEIIEMQIKWGIHKFKCATIAEAELLAIHGAKDILLAMQPVKINLTRFFMLIEKYPNAQFSTLVDNVGSFQDFSTIADINKMQVALWLDINNGMNRTGAIPDKAAENLYKNMFDNPHIDLKGIHVYDGHIKHSDFELRKKECDKAFESVIDLKKNLKKLGIQVPKIVAGGTPSFPIHVGRDNVEVSPGTTLLWDDGYGTKFKELDFLPAAVLATRVISKPKKNLSCFDLGHKFLAAENPCPRVKFFEMNNTEQISQSEEHLVIKHFNNDTSNIGDLYYGIPYHICPTVARYKSVLTITDRSISGKWYVAARDLKIGI